MYSLLEQHNDGTWWYHPGMTYDTPEEVEEGFRASFWWDIDRPHRAFEHKKPLPQEYATYTRDFKSFENCGAIEWMDNS